MNKSRLTNAELTNLLKFETERGGNLEKEIQKLANANVDLDTRLYEMGQDYEEAKKEIIRLQDAAKRNRAQLDLLFEVAPLLRTLNGLSSQVDLALSKVYDAQSIGIGIGIGMGGVNMGSNTANVGGNRSNR